MATTTTTTLGGTPQTTEVRTTNYRTTETGNRGIYWAIGIAIVLLAIVFAMRPIRDTAATSATGTVMSEAVPTTTNAVPVDPSVDRITGGTQTDATSGATYDDGTVNNTTTTPPTQRQ